MAGASQEIYCDGADILRLLLVVRMSEGMYGNWSYSFAMELRKILTV